MVDTENVWKFRYKLLYWILEILQARDKKWKDSSSFYLTEAEYQLQWTPLSRITLGKTITDLMNRMMQIREWASTYVRCERVIWDWINLIPLTNQLIPLSVIPLSGFHYIKQRNSQWWKKEEMIVWLIWVIQAYSNIPPTWRLPLS